MTNFTPRRFQVLPVVVKNLIIINVIVFLLQSVLERSGIDLSDYLGLHYWKSHYFGVWQLITYMFLHGSISHIFFNMFALWMFGSILEQIFGPKRFLIFFFVCGIGGALCHLGVLAYEFSTIESAFTAFQQNPTVDQFARFVAQHVSQPTRGLYIAQKVWENDPSNLRYANDAVAEIYKYLHGSYNIRHQFEPGIFDGATIGASGAIFGLLFGFGYLFPNSELYIYFLFPLKAKYFVALYALAELYSGFANSAGDNIAHFAHLGGMLFAFVLLKYWNKNERRHFY
jgi:membrane associated rhomboid family serine protease